MKDTEFFELLNLYLDHEISAADAARLEAEVQANPERRSVYHEYCRMQKACTVLAKDFTEQPAARKVIAFEPSRPAWASGAFAFGGFAVAAACVALVLVNRAPTAEPGTANQSLAQTPVVQRESLPVVARPVDAAPVARLVTTVPARRSEGRAMLASMPLTLTNPQADNAEALMAASQQNVRAQFEWMRNVQLAPIQHLPMEELRLDARSSLQPASRTYSSGRPMEGTVEMTSFKFQK